MNIQVISIFPAMFDALIDHGVVGRAIREQLLSLSVLNPRDYAGDKHSTIDGRPYGGGPGMVMTPQPMAKAIDAARQQMGATAKVVHLSPQGQRFDHAAAQMFAEASEPLILLAGRYEGVDQRVLDHHVDEHWSIGDYVLSGGELAAMVMIDAIARWIPDSLGNKESAQQDSFVDGLLDCPHYARPEVFDGESVPEVLLSGDHQAIKRWRLQQSLGRTWQLRPDLLEKLELTDEQAQLLEEFKLNLK